MPDTYRILVLVDRDDDDCNELKAKLVAAADRANQAAPPGKNMASKVINRIVIEELEAWYFGDWGLFGRRIPG